MLVETIKKICEQKNLSINALEQMSGIGRGNIGRWDHVSPGLDKVTAVADALGVGVDELLGRAEITPQMLDDNYKLLMDASKQLKPEDLKFMADMAEKIRASYRDE